MKISVIIPAYNEEKYIEQCLSHLLNQTVSPYEIIVINNNSTDHTVELLKKYPVQVIVEKQQGMIFARNAGFDHASGDVIARTDADCIVPNNWIEKIQIQFSDPKTEALTGGFIFYDYFTNYSWTSDLYQKIMKYFLKHNFFIGPNMIMRKTVWDEVKSSLCIDDKKVHEDLDMSIHFANLHKTILYDPQLTVQISARRLKLNPSSFFIEYVLRAIKTVKIHHIS